MIYTIFLLGSGWEGQANTDLFFFHRYPLSFSGGDGLVWREDENREYGKRETAAMSLPHISGRPFHTHHIALSPGQFRFSSPARGVCVCCVFVLVSGLCVLFFWVRGVFGLCFSGIMSDDGCDD